MKQRAIQNPYQERSSNRQEDLEQEEPKNKSQQAGLPRKRMKDIEELDELTGGKNHLGSEDDLKNENLNAANDQ